MSPYAAAARRFSGFKRLGFVIVAVMLAPSLHDTKVSAGETGNAAVTIEHQTFGGATPYTTTYRTAHGDCSIAWIAFNNEPGVVKYQTDCPTPLAEQLPVLRSLCSTFLSQDPNAAVFRTLFWGRLAPDSMTVSREMSLRLASAAFSSPGWDKVRGRPIQGDINRFARDLATRARIYPELSELFAGFHRSVTLSHVEKVLVLKAGQLPFFPQLAKLGVKAGDRLPFDCMAWFSVSPETGQ